MKTAMQTLISKLKTEISELNKKIDKYSNDTGVYTGHKYGLDQALSVAEELLEMEKKRIKDAYLMVGMMQIKLSCLIIFTQNNTTIKPLNKKNNENNNSILFKR